MINIDEIRNIQQDGIDSENAKKAAERGDGSWTADREIWEAKGGYDWAFLKRYFEGIGFFVSMTYDEYDYVCFVVAWDEKEIRRLRDNEILFEKVDSYDWTRSKFYNKLKRLLTKRA